MCTPEREGRDDEEERKRGVFESKINTRRTRSREIGVEREIDIDRRNLREFLVCLSLSCQLAYAR